jgi:hypothetical protein
MGPKKQFTARDKFILITKLVLYAAARFLALRAILLYKKLKLIKKFYVSILCIHAAPPSNPRARSALKNCEKISSRCLFNFS